MIVQVAPVEKNVAETICSLNFAQRVRTVELGQASKKMESGDVEVCYLVQSVEDMYVGKYLLIQTILCI